MGNKKAVQRLVIWQFIKRILTEQLPAAWKFIKVWSKKFITWRKARFARYRKLPWYLKIVNAALTFIVL